MYRKLNVGMRYRWIVNYVQWLHREGKGRDGKEREGRGRDWPPFLKS